MRVWTVVGLLFAVTGCVQRPYWESDERKPVPTTTADTSFVDPRRQVEPTLPYEPGVRSVIRGSDESVGSPSPRPGAAPRPLVRTDTGEVSLNFVDADIREVIRIILADNLRINYVVDPAVQGTVNLRTSRPIPMADLLPTLEDILALNGAALIRAPGLLKIVPADQALARGGAATVATRRPLSGDRSNIVLVPLQYASASEIEKALKPFAAPGSYVGIDAQRNLLILGGSPSSLSAMLDVVDTFDVDWMRGMSFGLFPVRSTDPGTMVENLEGVFGNQKEGPLQGVLRLVPIDRLNSVLVVTSRSVYLDKVEQWINRLDVGEDEVARIYVYYAENSRASDLATVLTDIFSPGEGPRSGALGPGLAASEISTRRSSRQRQGFGSSGSSDGTGTSGSGSASTGLGSSGTSDGGTSTGTSGGSGGGFGRSADGGGTTGRAAGRRPARGLGIGADLFGGQQEPTDIDLGTAGHIRVIADDVKNALVILAKPRDYRLVESALKQLDILPLQVLIEATIIEVVLNDALRYGVEYFIKQGDFAVTNRSSLNLGSIRGDTPSSFTGFSFLYRDSSTQVLLTALDEVTNAKVISSPSLFVLDNQTASLLVGDSVPIATRSAVSVTDPDAPVTNSIEYRDTGVILDVTPRVNSGGLVTLEISQEVSDVTQTTTSDLDSPTIRQRRVESTVAVQTGETVALGGLIRDTHEEGSSGIPFLSRIPLIGWLFGTQSDISGRTELLVLITPRVVPNQDSARRVTDELRQRMSQITGLEQRIR